MNEYIDYEAEKLLNIDKNINDVSLVFRYDNKYFQINKEVHQYNSDSHEYSSYEFVLCDFLDFWKKEHERLIPNIRGTYRNIICYLFNEYITTRECIFHNIENNVNTEALEPMRFGYDHGDLIIPSYVPNLKSITLCKHHLYRNIFKILLVNLQIFKKFKYCVYMSKEQVREFNNIAKTINQLKAGYNAH